MDSALQQARKLRATGDFLAEQCRKLAALYVVPPEEACACCCDLYPPDEMYPDPLNGLLCETCRDAFADVKVPEWNALDKD